MSSEFYPFGRRSNMLPYNNIPQLPSRSPLAGIPPDPATHLLLRRPDFISGKRSLAEFQQQHQQNHLRQPQSLNPYFRNVKQRMYYQASSQPNLSSVPEVVSSMNPRFGLPILLQQPRALATMNSNTFSGNMNHFGSSNSGFQNFVENHNCGINLGVPTSSSSFSPQEVEEKTMNRIQELEKELLDDDESDSAINMCVPTSSSSLPPQELETNMMNKLQELEKELLDDDDDDNDEGDEEVSGVINSEWSETFQNCLVDQPNKNHQQVISPSPTSSSSSSSSTSASPITCPKQLLIDAASAISEGKSNAAAEFLTRLSQVANVKGTPEQRLVHYMVSALRSRVNPTEFPAPISQLYSQEHNVATHNLYDISACFKLGFMAANLAILEATTMGDQFFDKLHVVDFDVGQGRQYLHLLHALAGQKDRKFTVLKITAVTDYFSRGGEEARVKGVGDTLKALGSKIGISLIFNVMSLKMNELSREKLGLMEDEALAVNLAFKLHKLPDESVTTENLRDELLRRVKRLSPQVVTVVEQEMSCNTATFGARVNEVFGYYSALFESLEAVVSRESPDRIRLEEGLGRKIANSVACEGSDRVERFEVFGKWRARMGMAGFGAKPLSQLVTDSLRSKLSTVTRGNRGFTVNEQSGGICFGWMGRSLTVASAWH